MIEPRPELFRRGRLPACAPSVYCSKTGSEAGQALVCPQRRHRRGRASATRSSAHNPDLAVRDLPGHLIMPGFIDAHHHLTQSFGKALAFGEPSEIFRRIWVPLEASLDGEGRLSGEQARRHLNRLRGGFTTVVDAGNPQRSRRPPRSRARTREAGAALRARFHLQ